MPLAAFENHMPPYDKHFVLQVPATNVVERAGLAPLKHDVRVWLYQNVGDNRSTQRPENIIWDYIGCMGEVATFAFKRQEDAALFRMFYG